VQPSFFRQHFHYVQETLESDLGPLPGREWATVKAFTGGEVPLVAHTEKAVTAERNRPILSRPGLRVHGVSRARFGLLFGAALRVGGTEPVLFLVVFFF
jgi:hypothetical protein